MRRDIVTTKPDDQGVRPYPSNPIRNCIPGMAAWFGNLDARASLAPRHALYTEGGNQADLDRVRRAYRIMDAEAALSIHHHPRYRDPRERRFDHVPVPEGLTPGEHNDYANADSANHFFHADIAVPWMRGVMGNQKG